MSCNTAQCSQSAVQISSHLAHTQCIQFKFKAVTTLLLLNKKYSCLETLFATLEQNFITKNVIVHPGIIKDMATKFLITKNVIDRARGMCREEKKCIVPFGEKT